MVERVRNAARRTKDICPFYRGKRWLWKNQTLGVLRNAFGLPAVASGRRREPDSSFSPSSRKMVFACATYRMDCCFLGVLTPGRGLVRKKQRHLLDWRSKTEVSISDFLDTDFLSYCKFVSRKGAKTQFWASEFEGNVVSLKLRLATVPSLRLCAFA